jgi:hypothetical protein
MPHASGFTRLDLERFTKPSKPGFFESIKDTEAYMGTRRLSVSQGERLRAVG